MDSGLDIINVWDLIPNQILMCPLTEAEQVVRIATGNEQQFQFVFGGLRIGDENSRFFGIGCGRKSTHPSEFIKISQSKIQ